MAMKLTKGELEAMRKSVASGESRNAMSKAQLEAYRKSNGENWTPIEYYKTYDLATADGKSFGKVSYDAYKAVENFTLDSYKPKNDEEKNAIAEFRKQVALPFVIEVDNEKVDFGKISYDAYKAIESGTVDNYTPVNDNEKKAIDNYTKFLADYAKEQREPEDFWQGLVHGAGYTAEKIGAGALDALLDAGNFLWAAGATIARPFTWGSWNKGVQDFASSKLSERNMGDVWSDSAESRYRVPDWYRYNVGQAATNLGAMIPAVVVEYFTASSAPAMDSILAKSLSGTANSSAIKKVATTLSSKLVKPKASEVVFGLSAAGSAAQAGYAQTGDVGKSLNYGILNGLGEVATERLFGGFGGTGIGPDELIDVSKYASKIPKIGKLATTKYGKKVLDVAFEGVEELIMAGADPVFQKSTLDHNANLVELYKNAGFGEAFFQGILLSSLMNAGTFAVNKTINTTNKIKTIKYLNKSLGEINPTLPNEEKLNPLTLTASVDEINQRNSDIQRVKGINVVNGAIDVIDSLVKSDEDKLEPLKYGATIEEIVQKQNEIGVFTMAYADVLVEELVKNNPEKFAHIEKLSVGDTFKDTKTGYTITVLERDSKNTKVQIDTGVNIMTKSFSNNQADNFATSGQLVETENERTNKFTDKATEQVYNALAGETLSSKTIDQIITTPELKQAFEQITGLKLSGTKAEQRAMVRNWHNNAKNAPESSEQLVGNGVIPSAKKSATEGDIAPVVNAINETLKEGALEEIYASMESAEQKANLRIEKSIDTFAGSLFRTYKKHGTIGHVAKHFTDGGIKVMDAMDSVLSVADTTVATPQSNLSNETVVATTKNTEGVLQNQSEGATIESKTTTKNVTNADKSHTVAYTNDNQKIDLSFKVVSVDDLIASNEIDGKVNPNYPQELQPRDRTRDASQLQITQIAANLNPARLADSTSVLDGAPIVGPDNAVESGNGRTLAIKLAYAKGYADNYRNFIINNADKYGIDVSNLPANPILVRERLTEVDRVEFTRKANESSISSLSATEQAKVDAEKLTDKVLSLLVANDDGEINTKDNKSFIEAVIDKVFNNEDLNNVVVEKGRLSQSGKERIQNAIFYKAYGDASLSARLSESLDNDMKNATKVLLNIAPKVVSIKNHIEAGNLYNFDFSGDIASAVKLLEKCRDEHTKIAEYAAQTTMFEKEPQHILEMAHIFETKNRGAKQATDFYNLLLDKVVGLGNPKQASFIDMTETHTKEVIFDGALKEYNSTVESGKEITIPEVVYRSESITGRNDDRRGKQYVSGGESAKGSVVETTSGVQQDNGRSEETGVVTDGERHRQSTESTEGKSKIREENGNEPIRKDLLHGNGKRRNDGGSRKQTGRILSFKRENQGKDATERQRFARELVERGQVKTTTYKSGNDTIRCERVKPEAYNDDMRAMVEKAKAKGIYLSFVVGDFTTDIKRKDGKITTMPIRGVQLTPSRILVKYDHSTFSPQQIYKHEYCHAKWNSSEMRKIRNAIFSSLSAEDRQTILSLQRYKDYMEGYNNENHVWEEFVCDVLSGYNEYTERFIDVVTEFWYGKEKVDGYDASSYATSTDAGGKYSFSSMGFSFFGNEDISSEEFEKMVNDGSYKKQKGYRDYVKKCVDVYKQSHNIKGMLPGSEVKKIEQQIEGIFKVAIAAKKAGFDIYDDGKVRDIKDSKQRLLFSSLEPNSDYFTSNDLATICDKARNFTDIYEAIIRAEEEQNVPVDKRFFNNIDNYFILHKIMADKGLTIPCDECYVQSMRKNLFPMAKAFIELVTETNPNNKENKQLYHQDGKDKGNIKKNNAKVRDKVVSAFNQSEINGKDADLQKLSNMNEDALAKLGNAIHEELNSEGSIKSVDDLTVEVLTTASGLAQLKLQAPKVYEAFNSFYGQSKPKMPREASPFRPGELIALLTKVDKKTNTISIDTKLINKIKSTGGFRLQSYSDFQIKNFVDVLQTIFEAGMLGLNGHAYTKVPAFLDATEGTNLKRNISIFMKEENGNWVIDKKNSFPKELEDIYALVASDQSGDTGIIAVSQNADMSAWIMANELLGYGIPFHKSGTQMDIVRSREGYENMIDHTNQQSEVYKTDVGPKKKANNKVSKPIDIYKFWDFKNKDNLSQKKLIEKNVKRYIDECEKRNYRPKFRAYVMDNQAVLDRVLHYAKKDGFVPQNATIEDISFKHGEYTIPYGYYKFLGDFGLFKPDGTASPIETLSLENYDFNKAVDFFKDASKLRQNELLQQFENGKVRDEYREKLEKGELTIEQLENILKETRNEVVQDVVDGSYRSSLDYDDVQGNIGYHAGDLGKSESLGQQGGYRDTGHFGTGTYFVGNKELVKDYNKRDGVPAPQHAVDFSNYNLYKVKSDQDGYDLHRQLQIIDGGIKSEWIDAAKDGDFSLYRSTEYYHIAEDKFGEDGKYTDEALIYGLTELAKKANIEIPTKKQYSDYSGYALTDEYFDSVYKDHLQEVVGEQIDDINDEYARFRDAYSQLEFRFGFKGQVYDAMNKVLEYQNANPRGNMDAYKKDSLATVFMKALGYGGIDTRGTKLDNTAYGSVIYDLTEDSILYDRDDAYAPTFYSQMGKVIDEMKMDKIAAKDVVRYLTDTKRGVKAEEIKWSGIEDFLAGKKSVTKTELQEFVANNQLQIEETVLEGGTAITIEPQGTDTKDLYVMRGGAIHDSLTWNEVSQFWESDSLGYTFLSEDSIRRYYGDGKGNTRWGDYKLEGGENYREIIFKMPDSNYSNQMMKHHWGMTGILAHARVQDFDVYGKKMLFIEEIQSDWHNQGHKSGYVDAKTQNEVQKLVDDYQDVVSKRKQYHNKVKPIIYNACDTLGVDEDEVYHELLTKEWDKVEHFEKIKQFFSDDDISNLKNDVSLYKQQIAIKQKMNEAGVNASVAQDAPFRNNYHEYVLKRLIRMAAEEGYDSIGWTPADIQSKRWSDDYAEGYRIEYDQDIPKFLNKYGKKWGAKVWTMELRTETDDWYESDGTMVWSMPITDSMKDSVLYEGQARYSLDTDGILDLEDLWSDAIDKYGTIPKGEIPSRDVAVPKKINEKDVVSLGARTMMEAGVTPDWAVSEFEKAILDGTMTHEVITNKKAGAWAKQQIERLGFEEALNSWNVYTRDGKVGKKELALGMELYNQCITNKDVHNAMKLAAELVAEATNAGQTLQAVRMLKRMTPDGQLYYLEKSIQKMNEEFKDKLGKQFKDIELDNGLVEEFLTETDTEKRDEVYDKICQNIADQIPSTFKDKWNSWRYLAMLGNPRTHIRNIVGNAIFIPSIRLKNYVGAVIEKASRVDIAERTKSLHKSKEAVAFAKKDITDKDVMRGLKGVNAKYATTDDIESKRTIFDKRWQAWIEKLRTKNFEWLEKEDGWFLKIHYVDALARLITARKIDVNSIDAKTLEKLRKYAIKEAQAATYRDANAIADGLNAIQRKIERSDKKIVRASSVLLEGVMPFKKTPMNIAKQGIYYSPVGILKGIYTATTKLKKGDATVTEVIDDFAKGLTGTGMMLLGLLLANMGILVGADDKEKKEKEFDKMVGEQDYAIKIGDFSYTIDWATPSNLSLFIGAKLYDLTKDEFSFADVVSSVSTIAEPLLELSVFSGVSGVIESAQYSDTNPIIAIGSDMITSYFMQALPTIGGQVSRIVDGSKREYYYADKNSDVPAGLQRLIGQASSKVPFASYLFEPAIDEWGREETYGNVVERAFENTVSPGYYSAENYTRVDKELRKLYEKTGDSAVLPVSQQKYYTEDSVKYDMTAEEYTRVKKLRGRKSFELVRDLISSSDYMAMTDKEKVKAIKNCYTDAGDYAKEQMIDKVKRKNK